MNVQNVVGVLLQWIVCIHFLSFAKILRSSMFFPVSLCCNNQMIFLFFFITISVLLVLFVLYQEPGVQLRPHERH